MTNFEKIKSMSKEQMTHFMLDIMLDTLNNNVCGYCENCDAPCLGNEEIIRKWLESEAEERKALKISPLITITAKQKP